MSIAKGLVYSPKESEDSDIEALGNDEEEVEAEHERANKRPAHWLNLEMLLMISQ